MHLKTLPNFLLLAHHPEKGRFLISGFQLNYGIIGAVLLEMSMDEQIKIENNRLILSDIATSKAPIYAEIISELRQVKKVKRIKYWVSRLAKKARKYKWIILEVLEQNGIVKIEHKKFLGLIPYRLSYLLEVELRNELIEEVKNSILSEKEPNEGIVPLLGLVEACKMHRMITRNRQELKQIKKALKEILKNSPIASSVDQTIKEVQAAIITSVAASAAISATNN